ncbi:hypothetical protein [Stackebrandtia nassauensis]|uniref:Uncharacterized protein n=1 Tax=Stackebrandtia nassauensis (strain DSM 44728 / CIP 108903 / NRRL B-16338 / NBRC 102104 / LLR-40K-21) TaxID=446470 RepID=D3PY34_STANL|nr:hypothetical protein [Stackebrandtia nassauensis]ADD45363.1 hypothetical protein Snas_5733 [Stackebrandtia nassauensis DSM 44728]
MATDHPDRDGWQSTRWVIGLVLFVQGFGSAITESLWHTSFGAAALLRSAGLPQWTDLLVGAVGVGLLVWAAARARSRRKANA